MVKTRGFGPQTRTALSRARPGALLLALLVTLAPALVLAASVPASLERLLARGDYEAAYELAREHRRAHEGEPRFDFHYGVAALETGQLGEAVFALRRVLALRPSSTRARLQLARARFLQGQDLLARQEFERVLARDPPAPVRARIERYLHALDRRAERYSTSLSGHIELGGGHDSNVTTATDVDTIELTDRTIASDSLADGAREQSDEFTRIAGELRLSHPLRPGLNLFARIDGQRRYHAEWTGFETGHVQLRAGTVLRGARTRTVIGARARRFDIDGRHYRDTTGIDASLRYTLSEVQVAQVEFGHASLRHDAADDRVRDSDLTTLVVGTTRLWHAPLRPTMALFVLLGDEDARRDAATDDERNTRANAERTLSGVGADLRLTLSSRWSLHGGLRHRRSDYALVAPAFGEEREDDYAKATLALRWQPAPRWRAQAELSHTNNDSNIDFYAYERDVAELSLRYQF